MNGSIVATELVFSPQVQSASLSVERLPAAAGAAGRFEQLMYSPTGAAAHAVSPSGAVGAGTLRHYVDQLSRRWDVGQSALERLMDTGQFTSKDLVLTQVQLVNCALDVEISSRCASMFENGVQTLVQRGS